MPAPPRVDKAEPQRVDGGQTIDGGDHTNSEGGIIPIIPTILFDFLLDSHPLPLNCPIYPNLIQVFMHLFPFAGIEQIDRFVGLSIVVFVDPADLEREREATSFTNDKVEASSDSKPTAARSTVDLSLIIVLYRRSVVVFGQ